MIEGKTHRLSLVFYYDFGSKVVLNYWAAYEFDAGSKRCEANEHTSAPLFLSACQPLLSVSSRRQGARSRSRASTRMALRRHTI